MTTAPPLVLGRYRLDEQIAVGGTARVWRGWDTQLDRPVAVKLLHPHLRPDETSRRRLAGEARAAAALSHPAIATVYDVSGADEDPAIVMELVDGDPLSGVLARTGPMRPAAAARLAAEVAEALYHAHQQGIVHRDVKPANILVETGSGRARLIDFGIAHSLEIAAESLTHTGTAIGTPRYMAPEQLAGEQIGPRTDLWGLGCVLYEALSGEPPFSGSGPLAISREQAAGPAPIPGADAPLAAVAHACLAVPISDRPVHAGRVAEALRAWERGDTQPAMSLAPGAAATATMPVTRSAPVPRPAPVPAAAPGSSTHRRKTLPLPVLLLVVGGVLAAAVILAAFAMGGFGGTAAASPTPLPTTGPPAGWRNALLADYQQACGEDGLQASDLSGMTYAQATRYVDGLIGQCQSGGNGGNGGGNGRGHGHGHGQGD
jgi:predicted Ser/Thr protein kinase